MCRIWETYTVANARSHFCERSINGNEVPSGGLSVPREILISAACCRCFASPGPPYARSRIRWTAKASGKSVEVFRLLNYENKHELNRVE